MNRKSLAGLLCLIVVGAANYALVRETGVGRTSIREKAAGDAAGGEPRKLPTDDDLLSFDDLTPVDQIVPGGVELAVYDEPVADDEPKVEITLTDPGSGSEKHLLEYKFTTGETLRWEVEHRAQVRTTVQGTTQTADTVSNSIKVWKVIDVTAEGRSKFVYSVESVDMLQRLEGRQDVHYNSLTDPVAPPGFEDVAKSVGIDLSVMTLDRSGNMVEREELRPNKAGTATPQEMITPPFPAQAISTGARWQIPADIRVTLSGGEVKKIAARQKFTLEEVTDGLATIRIETVILTPVRDPEIEAQMVQSKANGLIRFDIESGRLLSQQSDVDERVAAFQGEGSAMHYVTRFVEKLLPAAAKSARRRPLAGPAAP